MDLTVVRTDILNRPDGSGQQFAKALAGAWYETMSQMSGGRTDKVLAAIAEGSQDTLASYKEQLSTTKMFYTPQAAVAFGASPDLKQKMASGPPVLLRPRPAGRRTRNPSTMSPSVIRMAPCRARRIASAWCFDLSYMQMAAQGKL